MLDILDFGTTELELFVNTINQIFCCVLQISENARIVEQGTWVHDLIRHHDDCRIYKRLSLNCQIKDAKTFMEKQNKLEEELRQSRISEKELLEIEHIKASCKSQEAEIQKLIDSLVSFCNKS
ncbi:unnamed protein product [Prunus brigantina]